MVRSFQDNYNYYHFFDFLVEYIEKGTLALTDLNVSLDAVRNNHQHIEKSFYANPIKIQVGKNLINENESLYLNLNDTKLYNNCHIAVAGNSGTGKTQFALEFLSQIYEQSNGHVNFIYLDFKGLKQDDIKPNG